MMSSGWAWGKAMAFSRMPTSKPDARGLLAPARRLPAWRHYLHARNAMNLTRVAVTVGLACVAASLVARRSGAAPVEADDGSWTGNSFKPTSQESAEARAPGLPDFARGA
jgi:hypothetical protein